jgi:hypothetical protein
MLSSELEPRETATSQCMPEIFFLVGLILAKLTRNGFEAHGKNSNPLSPALSPLWRGEGDKAS